MRLKNLIADIDVNYQYYDFHTAAKFMCMHETYFSHLFRTLSGMTFTDYLNQVRVEKAVDILHSGEDLSMTEVSLRCGFASIRNFNRMFKKYTGLSPRDMPNDFVFRTDFSGFSNIEKDPTAAECVLIESSDSQ